LSNSPRKELFSFAHFLFLKKKEGRKKETQKKPPILALNLRFNMPDTTDDDTASDSITSQWLYPAMGVCVLVVIVVGYSFSSQPGHSWQRRSASSVLVVLAVVVFMLLVGACFNYEASKLNNSIESNMLSSIGSAACYSAGALFLSLMLTYLLPRSVRRLISNVTNRMVIEEEEAALKVAAAAASTLGSENPVTTHSHTD
jgi:hypothetical protein